MITNKDLSIDSENGKITLNGNKYDLGTQGEIDTVVKSVRDYVNELGVKNLIPYPYVNTTQTINNVNFTDNGDGSISADNAASAITQFRLYGWTTGISPLLLRKGTYILSGCPSGGGINSLRLYIHNQDSSFTAMDDGEGTKFTLSNDTYVGIAIRVANGYDADGKTVYPMLRLASDINDDTYVQYAMTNKQLTDQLATKQDTLTFDSTPTASSTNPVESGGINTAINNKISVVQPANEEVTVTGPYTDIAFTPPIETGYTFYLIGAVAINLANWNMSNINPVAGSIRIYTSDTSSVTSQVKTTWLKIKNS